LLTTDNSRLQKYRLLSIFAVEIEPYVCFLTQIIEITRTLTVTAYFVSSKCRSYNVA